MAGYWHNAPFMIVPLLLFVFPSQLYFSIVCLAQGFPCTRYRTCKMPDGDTVSLLEINSYSHLLFLYPRNENAFLSKIKFSDKYFSLILLRTILSRTPRCWQRSKLNLCLYFFGVRGIDIGIKTFFNKWFYKLFLLQTFLLLIVIIIIIIIIITIS